MTTLYATTRELDGLKGSLRLVAAGDAYSLVEPCAQLALIILRTPRGSCLADPSLGVPWGEVERSPTTMQASARRAIQSGFAPFEQAGRITLLSSNAEEGPLGRLLVEVEIADPKRPTVRIPKVSTTVAT